MFQQYDPLNDPPPAPGFGKAFLYWLKLGFISFGGPAGQISMMHHELVDKRRWISERRFMHALNYCMVLPGPEAQQLATYIGWLMHGTWGGIVSGVLFVLPSLLILILLSWIYMAFGSTPAVTGILYGVKPAVTAIVLHAAFRIGSRALTNKVLWSISAIAFIAISAFKIPFPYIVIGAGLAGLIGSKITPSLFNLGTHHSITNKTSRASVIDDHSPKPEHSRFSWNRLSIILFSGLGLWLAVMGLLVHKQGWQGDLANMGLFFTKAALLTFGGAYAVLPYVYQGAVEHYHWLTATQMIDGLALGETTPGPLIMVVAFVGFVGGWTKGVLGSDALLLAAACGAATATFFTFLPSFLFILVGGPLVESTHGDIKFTAPLTGITAAVVGVILNLAVFFAYHVLWPQQWEGGFEWFACLITLAASTALMKFKAGVIPVIGISGLAGCVYLAAR